MGHSTDFLGRIDINPGLNDAEQDYLRAFRLSRRFDRRQGPYAVPGNPYLEESDEGDIDAYNRVALGQPQLWCQWQVCWEGCCLTWDGREKFYEPVAWLRYLIDHFLKPGGLAGDSGLPLFAAFTFDHRLDGLVMASRRDNRQLSAICVQDNVVSERVLMRGDAEYGKRPPLAYEQVLDDWAAELEEIRSGGRGLRAV